MGNFIGMVYATLKNEGVDTKGMSTDDAVKKYNELQEKSGGKSGEKEPTPAEQKRMEEKGIEEDKSYTLSESDKNIVDDAIYWAKKKGNASVRTVFEQIDEDAKGFRGDAYKDMAITNYIKQQLGDPMDAEEKRLKEKYGEDAVERSSFGGGFVIKEKENKDIGIRDDIDYDNVTYPKGTSKEYTMMVNDKYRNAIYRLKGAGIDIKDFKYKPAKEGGIITNTAGIMQKYIFEPFNKKYPKGNNSAWEREYKPLYDAIEAVDDKVYNDWWILNK